MANPLTTSLLSSAQTDLLLAFGVCVVGTFLLRAAPLVWMRRHLKRQDADAPQSLPLWLSILGPLMIAAMCGVSLVPTTLSLAALVATLTGGCATVLSWRKTRSLGLPVCVGVAAYALIWLGFSSFG